MSQGTLERVNRRLAEQEEWLDAIERSAARFRIVGTLPYGKVEFWNRVVHTIAQRPNWASKLTARIGIPDVTVIFRLLACAPRYQLVLLAGGERSDLIYAALAGLCPWIRTPHIIVDAHWQKAGGTAGQVQRLLLRMARRLLHEVQPHSAEEVAIYAREFGISDRIIRPIPWSTSLIGYDTRPVDTEEVFVLTGGHSFRDYPVFIEAAGRLGVKVKIGLSSGAVSPDVARLAKQYKNVEVRTDWSNRDYFQQMARCTVYAMPIEQGLTRSTADQTILNAMHLGKIVVATDSIGPRIYLRDGENGYLVEKPTVESWSAALGRALNLSGQERSRLVDQAVFDARVRFNEHIRLGRTLDQAIALLDKTHRVNWHHLPDAPASVGRSTVSL